MENKRRVRNYIVDDKSYFCDLLAKTLCRNNISFVQIENEFHFYDKILRFYNLEEVAELSDSLESPWIPSLISDGSELDSNQNEVVVSSYSCKLPVVPTYNRTMMVRDSREIRQKVKSANSFVKRNVYRRNGIR